MNQFSTIRLPVHVAKRLKDFQRDVKALTQQLGHEATPEESSQHLRRTPKEVSKLLEFAKPIVSLDNPMDHSIGNILQEIVDDNSPGPEETLLTLDQNDKLVGLLACLTNTQREIICRRFGLCGHEAQILEDIAFVVGVSRERVRQIEAEALKKLNRICRRQGFSCSI